MTPNIHIRSFSDDQYWLDKVFYTNSYRIKGNKDTKSGPIIVDIGAHCGYFSFTALALGAKKIYAVEPFIENFKMLLKNVGDNFSVITHNFAIGKNNSHINFEYAKPQKSHLVLGYPAICDTNVDRYFTAPMWRLDSYLHAFVNEPIIDILKINIGGQERDILKSSGESLNNVQSICGETILELEEIAAFKAEMSALGFVKSHVISNTEETNKIFFIFSKNDIEQYYNL